MRILGVDLAASSSAFTLLEEDHTIVVQGDSYGLSDQEFVHTFMSYAAFYSTDFILIEDLPYNLQYRPYVQDVLRLQGRIMTEAERLGLSDRLRFVTPMVWQRAIPGVWKGKAPGALAAAQSLGYESWDLLKVDPRFDLKDLTGAPRTKLREAGKKLMTDYTDAWLIAHWGLTQGHTGLTVDRKGVLRPRVGPGLLESRKPPQSKIEKISVT